MELGEIYILTIYSMKMIQPSHHDHMAQFFRRGEAFSCHVDYTLDRQIISHLITSILSEIDRILPLQSPIYQLRSQKGFHEAHTRSMVCRE